MARNLKEGDRVICWLYPAKKTGYNTGNEAVVIDTYYLGKDVLYKYKGQVQVQYVNRNQQTEYVHHSFITKIN